VKSKKTTDQIIGSIINIHRKLGSGFNIEVYRKALVYELTQNYLHLEVNRIVPIVYNHEKVGTHKLDMVINHEVMLVFKEKELEKKDLSKAYSYLKIAGVDVALLVNFTTEKAQFKRIEI